MHCETAHLIYFSPTKTTAQCVENIAMGLEADNIVRHDLTTPRGRTKTLEIPQGDMVILGMPVYYGRIPALFHEALPIKGNNAPAIFVTNYGNRHFDDALLELTSLGRQAELQPLAAIACISQHSLNSTMASGRPDNTDREALHKAGEAALKKLQALKPGASLPELHIPGNVPYKAYGSNPLVPHLNTEACTACGSCAEKCPVGIIRTEDFTVEHKEACIFCMACVKYCPAKARGLSPEEEAKFAPLMAKLAAMNADRKELQLFL